MKQSLFFLSSFLLFLSGCIGDDIIFDTVEESVRITDGVDSLAVDDTYQFLARFSNNIGEVEDRPVNWLSSDPEVLSIDQTGLATGLSMGTALVTAEVFLDGKPAVSDTQSVIVADRTSTGGGGDERTGKIQTTSSYVLTGEFTLREDGEDLLLEFGEDYQASSNLPGLYVYLTNNAATINNAYEIGKVTAFSGAHSYRIAGVGLQDYDYLLYYCKPFSVKVGDGKISD